MNPAIVAAASNPEMVKSGTKIAKYAGIGLGCFVAFLIGRKLYKNWKANKDERDVKKALENLPINKNEATITKDEATFISDNLYKAMADFGTKENIIEQMITKLKSATDWYMVMNAFGTKEYGNYGKPLSSWFPSNPMTLIQWLREECSTSLMNKIEKQLYDLKVNV